MQASRAFVCYMTFLWKPIDDYCRVFKGQRFDRDEASGHVRYSRAASGTVGRRSIRLFIAPSHTDELLHCLQPRSMHDDLPT